MQTLHDDLCKKIYLETSGDKNDNKTYESALSEMASVRREAEDDLRDVVLMVGVAEEHLTDLIKRSGYCLPVFNDVFRGAKTHKTERPDCR